MSQSEAYRGTCDLAVVAPIAAACARLADMVPVRDRAGPPCPVRALPQDPPTPGDGGLLPAHVFTELARRWSADTVIVEETPSTRLDLLERIPARTPLGFFSNGGGWLGFGLTGAVGLRDALPERPVVAVIGDGSALYTVQSLWTAAHYDIGLLAIVMRNKRYAIMDTLATATGAAGPWPGIVGVDVAGVAASLGCPSRAVRTREQLTRVLDEVMPGLRDRRQPLLVQVELTEAFLRSGPLYSCRASPNSALGNRQRRHRSVKL